MRHAEYLPDPPEWLPYATNPPSLFTSPSPLDRSLQLLAVWSISPDKTTILFLLHQKRIYTEELEEDVLRIT